MTTRWICQIPALALLVIGVGCSATGPEAFELEGTFNGTIEFLGGGPANTLGDLSVTFRGIQDGVVEEYDGDGTLITTNDVFRLNQVQLDYNTSTMVADLVLFGLFALSPSTVLTGTFDGEALDLEDNSSCLCRVTLMRPAP